jgi:hypothetical protein
MYIVNSVTQAEAANWESNKEERQQRAEQLKQHLLDQYKRRGQAPPEVLSSSITSRSENHT